MARSTTLAILFGLTAMVVAAGGCGSREHMRADFGKQTREFHARQAVHNDASTQPVEGLDSEEAALIHKSYRKQLGSSSGEAPRDSNAKILVLEPSDDQKK